MQSYGQLPKTLPVFPLANAIVLPGSNLPLNIFEPRYLNMVQDAMKTDHLIGMIQPRDNKSMPGLYNVGCAGRIIRYDETWDGRLEIVLTGLSRFRISEEIKTLRGYRMVKPEWSEFSMDFEEQEPVDAHDRNEMMLALKSYMKASQMDADWTTLDRLSPEELTNSLVGVLPIDREDKQMLIEAETLVDRVNAFTAILQGSLSDTSSQH
jgi:Lon protease-like protein